MKSLKHQYRDLEMRVYNELRNMVYNSKHKSKHTNTNAIEVNVFDYKELTIINDRLTFLDESGYHYSIYADVSLEDLIDILP